MLCAKSLATLSVGSTLPGGQAVAEVLTKWIPRAHASTLDPIRASEIRSIYNWFLVAFDASSHCL